MNHFDPPFFVGDGLRLDDELDQEVGNFFDPLGFKGLALGAIGIFLHRFFKLVPRLRLLLVIVTLLADIVQLFL